MAVQLGLMQMTTTTTTTTQYSHAPLQRASL